MGSGGNGVGTFGNHSGFRHITHDFGARKMTADTGFCTLTHFDFNGGAGFQIILMYTKSARSNLNYCVFAVAVKIFVESAFTGVVKNTQFL